MKPITTTTVGKKNCQVEHKMIYFKEFRKANSFRAPLTTVTFNFPTIVVNNVLPNISNVYRLGSNS